MEMKKIIALSALMTVSGVMAQSTTSTDLDVSKKSLKERISASWFIEAQDKVAGNDEGATQDVEVYNSVSLKFQVTNTLKAYFNPRFTIQDSGDDRFNDHDLRLGLTGNVIGNDLGISTTLEYIVPTTANTLNDDDFDGQVRLSNDKTFKIDDANSLIALIQLRRTFVKNTDGPHSELSILPWLSYTNTKLSEKAAIRVDYEGNIVHNAGKSLNNMTEAGDQDNRILVGADIASIPGLNSVYAYATHYPMRTKALDQTGLGVQIYKAF